MKCAKDKLVLCAKEDHDKPIFSIQFNQHVTYDMFATVGSNRITVYRVVDDNVEPILCFADPNTDENFYCCCWGLMSFVPPSLKESALKEDNLPKTTEIVLMAAGAHGIIRIISTSNPSSIKYLSGHGGAINDMKVSPISPELVLSGSKDHSVRLWNIQTDVCIAIFGGVEGHRDEVLSLDFHCSGSYIVSCGMDHSLKIWKFDQEILASIELSKKYNDAAARKSFPTIRKHFPTFSTRDIHRNYVDCAAWYGNFIISKSCEDKVVCWRPGRLESPTDLNLPTKYTTDTTCSILENFEVKHCNIWFLRFSIDRSMKYLALGNKVGEIYVFDIDSHDHDCRRTSKFILSNPKCTHAIRQTCFNNNSNILICACEDGSIWRWNNPQS